MQSEQDWIGRLDVDEDNGAAQRYQYFMRPEPFEDLGPIRLIDDEFLGPETKVREMSVGMTRNAPEERKKRVTVYLKPYPHIRIEKGKPLQGWYKSLHEPPGKRPRPCFTDAILTEPYGGYCAVGCAFAVLGGQYIDAPIGKILVDELKTGDVVWGRTNAGVEAVTVGEVAKLYHETVYEIKTTHGTIYLTGDHPVFANGRWTPTEFLKTGDSIERLFELRTTLRNEVLWDFLRKPIQRQEASETYSMQGLFNSFSSERSSWELSNSLRRLFDGNTFSKRFEIKGQTEWLKRSEEIFCNSQANVRSGQENGYGWQSLAFVESQRQETRYRRLPVQRSLDEVQLGSTGGDVLGLNWSELGVRTRFHNSKERSKVHSGFQNRRTDLHRSEGVLYSGMSFEDTQSEGIGLFNSTLESTQTDSARIVSVKKVQGGTVYDFETSSENYYVDGLLVHNCYINSGMRGYRGTGLISVPLHYGDQVADQLKKVRRAAAGYFSSFTDPFTPLEDFYHNTEGGAKAFVDAGLPIFFLSRLQYPEWAIDFLTRNKYSYAQKSINTPNARDWQLLSPGAMSLQGHLDEIAKLKSKDIYVSIQVNPIIPGVTTHGDVLKLFKRLKEAGADHVIVKFVEAGYSWAPAMVAKIKKRFGEERGERFERLFTQNIGSEKTIEESYRMEGHRLYSKRAAQLGLTYATCYEYRYERDANGDIVNKVGISVGREFTTAEQCHGHRVPMFQKVNKDDKTFVEVPECPPTGCLYCAAENPSGQPRCGDPLAGEAKALRLVDLKVPFQKAEPDA